MNGERSPGRFVVVPEVGGIILKDSPTRALTRLRLAHHAAGTPTVSLLLANDSFIYGI